MPSLLFAALRRLLPLLLLAAALPASAGRVEQQTVSVEGDRRDYLIYYPDGYRRGEPLPLVLFFHGGFRNAEKELEFSGIGATADRHRFLVVLPEGTGGRFGRGDNRTWNAGGCCGVAARWEVDDVGYVRTVLDDVEQRTAVDRARVYATGVSNGGMLVYRLYCEMSDRLAAAAPVAAALVTYGCRPQRPIPLLHIHGTADENVPWRGGRGRDSKAGVSYPSVEETLATVRRLNGCGDRADDKALASDVVEESFRCPAGREVVLEKIEGGGHTWPGVDRPGKAAGGSLSGGELVWRFFAEHAGDTAPARPPQPAEEGAAAPPGEPPGSGERPEPSRRSFWGS